MTLPLAALTKCRLFPSRFMKDGGDRVIVGLLAVDVIAEVTTVAALALSYFSIISIPPTATYACISTAGIIVGIYVLFIIERVVHDKHK
jgi:hypothetical protein